MPKKILIADDDPGILDALTLMFELEGFEVASSLTGFSIDDIEKYHPDIILLDIWMSGQDGRDMCRAFKSHETTRRIPVLLISASRDIRKSALDSGADDFLEKPFEMTKLLEVIQTHTG